MWPPSKIVSGDSIKWESEFSDYPPTDYTLSWAIRGLSNLDVIAESSGDKFLTTLTATQTSLLLPGQYFYQAYLTSIEDPENRTTIKQDSFNVLPNLALESDYDGRSEVEKLLHLVNRAISELIKDNVVSYRIKEREVTKQDLPELIKWRDQLKIEFARLKQAEAGLSRRLFVRF